MTNQPTEPDAIPLPDDTPDDESGFTFGEMLKTYPPVIQHSVEQLAMYQNMRDNLESGTARWESLDITAHESYLKEAFALLMATIALGWTHEELPA